MIKKNNLKNKAGYMCLEDANTPSANNGYMHIQYMQK